MNSMYFDGLVPADIYNSSKQCSWQVVHVRRTKPAFFHIRHAADNTDLIGVRGTLEIDEIMQDFSLFNQVGLIGVTSFIVPITSLLPSVAIARIIDASSRFEGFIDAAIRESYDGPVFEYVYNYLQQSDTPNMTSLFFAGHSLGGALGQIVGAQINNVRRRGLLPTSLSQLEIKSFALASPGVVLNARKFAVHIEDLYETAIILKPRHDVVSEIDIQSGSVNQFACLKDEMLPCHLLLNSICALMRDCDAYQSNNPDLIAAYCEYPELVIDPATGMDWGLMMYANYSS